jgi:hypothetical protein
MMHIASRMLRLVALPLLFVCAGTHAQKDVGKVIVGYPPGQSVDVVARLLVERLGPALGRTLIVENMPGQSGSVALAAVARMPADGSIVTLSASAALAGNPFLYKQVRYDSVRDFEPIGLVYDAPLVLMVNSKLPIESFRQLVDHAKANPGDCGQLVRTPVRVAVDPDAVRKRIGWLRSRAMGRHAGPGRHAGTHGREAEPGAVEDRALERVLAAHRDSRRTTACPLRRAVQGLSAQRSHALGCCRQRVGRQAGVMPFSCIRAG